MDRKDIQSLPLMLLGADAGVTALRFPKDPEIVRRKVLSPPGDDTDAKTLKEVH